MSQTYLFLCLTLALFSVLYMQHRRAQQRRQEQHADRRAMMAYLAGDEREWGGFREL